MLSENELHFVDDGIQAAEGPRDRFISVIAILKSWAVDTEFRGCAFLNAASEIPDPTSRLRKVGTRLYDKIRTRVKQLAKELIESDPKYRDFTVEQLVEDYMVAFSGAVALSQIYHAVWPIEQAIDSIERLIGE